MAEKSQSGTRTHGVTTGFGSTSNRGTNKTSDLQAELIRFLNAGVIGKEHLPVSHAKAAMLVRTNMLMKGYSGIRWDLLEALSKLMNSNLIPKLPLRGTVSGDLIPLSYVAGVLTGQQNCKVLTPEGKEISSIDALKRIGMEAPFELQAKSELPWHLQCAMLQTYLVFYLFFFLLFLVRLSKGILSSPIHSLTG